jgi:aquaporin Z
MCWKFVGAFFVVLITGTVSIEPVAAGGLAPVALGAALMAMVYAGGHISRAHYNPAVTPAV